MRLTTEGLAVRYRGVAALRNVSLTANPGEVLALVGANGSGKSSLLRALAGLQRHDGLVFWDGGAAPPARIGYMAQDHAVRAALSVFEMVLLGRLRGLSMRVQARDTEAAEAALAEVGIAGLARRRIGELSGGQRQMVMLAQVLAADPAALLLDEPTSALDILHQVQVLELVREITRRRRLVTVAVLHDLNAAARFADRMALLHDGELIAMGLPTAILRPDLLGTAFGVEVTVDMASDGYPSVLPFRSRR